jgi:ketosteroid isomerase-like protein
MRPFTPRRSPVLKPDTLAKLQAAYREWHDTRGRSHATWIALMAEDVEMRSIADGSPGMEFSAPRKGRDAAHAYFSTLAADWEMVHFTPEEFIVDGDRVVVFSNVEFRNRRTGKSAASPVVARWRFRDGEVVEYFEFYDTAKAFAAATPDRA